MWARVSGELPWPNTRRAVRCTDFVAAIKAEATDPIVLTVTGPLGLRVGSYDVPDVGDGDTLAASLFEIMAALSGKARAHQGVIIDPERMRNFPRDLVALYQVGGRLVAVSAMRNWFYVFPNGYSSEPISKFRETWFSK